MVPKSALDFSVQLEVRSGVKRCVILYSCREIGGSKWIIEPIGGLEAALVRNRWSPTCDPGLGIRVQSS